MFTPAIRLAVRRPIARASVAAPAVAAMLAAVSLCSSAAAGELVRLLSDAETSIYRWESTCNTYVVQRGARALLIDPGDGGVFERLAEIGVDEVDWLLLTSHHRERSQGLGSVEHTTARVAAPQAERELFEDPTVFRKWYPALGDRYSVYGASYVRPPRLPIPLDQGLVDGERFAWEGLELQCLATPGNSPGGMTYLVEVGSTRVALTGGLVHDGAKMVNWFDTEWDYGFGQGIDVLLESVARLIELDAQLLLPAHGPPIRDPDAQLPLYLAKLQAFRESYLRGYPVFDMTRRERDPISVPTEVPGLSQVVPGLYKLTEAERGWNFAIIISPGGRGLVLDCGLLPQEMLDQLIVGMRQHLGLTGIDALWISHMHGDHFLLGPHLREQYGAETWTLDRIVDKIENPRRYDYAALVSAYGDGFDGMPIDRAFHDGEAIEWEGYRLQIDWMPGQTEFGNCLWLEMDGQRIAFTGDNLFANPADPTHNGHEAVVARNSCVFEEGYLYGSRYLLELAPDIIMGSHSYVMPDPVELLERYHQWAHEIIEHYRGLLPGERYEYRFDPYWVSAYPYRVELSGEEDRTVAITVRNFQDQPQRHRVVLRTPPGVVAQPEVLMGSVDPEDRETYEVKLQVRDAAAAAGVGIVALDVTLDGHRYGEWFDFLVRTRSD